MSFCIRDSSASYSRSSVVYSEKSYNNNPPISQEIPIPIPKPIPIPIPIPIEEIVPTVNKSVVRFDSLTNSWIWCDMKNTNVICSTGPSGSLLHNVEEVCENVEEVCENVEEVCENVEEVSNKVEEVCENVEEVCENVEEVCENVEEVSNKVEEVCENVEEVGNNIEEVSNKIDITEKIKQIGLIKKKQGGKTRQKKSRK